MLSTMWRLLMLAMMLMAMVAEVRGYPQGPPVSACGDMFPQGHKVDAKPITPPYTLSASPATVAAGETVTLSLEATGDSTYPYYEGMFVQARWASCDSDEPVGTFTVPQNDDFLKLMTCNNTAASAVSNKVSNHETNKTFTWTAPTPFQGRIYFRATVVKNKENFWTNVFSSYVTYTGDTSQAPAEYCTVRSTWSSSVPGLSASLIVAVIVTSFSLMYNL